MRMASGLIAAAALAGMTSVLIVTFYGQSRIFMAMSRDGLLPPSIFGAIHPRFRTPHRSTILTGCVVALIASFIPVTELERMVCIGTLLAFAVVCAAVLLLRLTHPDHNRPFRCPFVYVVAPLGILVNFGLTLFLPPATWIRLGLWLAVGLAIYFGYGYRHSLMRKRRA